MGVSINGGTPKWMVYSGTSQSKMDDLGGTPISGNPHIYIYIPIGWDYLQLHIGNTSNWLRKIPWISQ